MGELVNKQAKFLLDVCKLIQKAYDLNFIVTGGELYRPIEMQEVYIKQGKSKTMNSMHLQRLAIDLHFFKYTQPIYDVDILRPLGEYWKSLNENNKWGGDFITLTDSDHFERG